jgi:CRISPR-associated helicase Cas3
MMGGLSYIYRRSVEDFGFYGSSVVRSFVEYALERVEDSLKSGLKRLIIVRAPPGIGKTAVPLTILLSILKGYDLGVSSVIHVAPTRSLIDDLAFRIKSSLAKLLGDTLAERIVARQHGLAHETSNLAAAYTITTFDTYLYNFFKLPTDEIEKIYRSMYGHYEVPRSAILASLNFLDEVHLVAEEESKMAKALATSIKALVALRTPAVISTATLSDDLLRRIDGLLQVPRDHIEVIDYKDFIEKRGVDEFYAVESSKEFVAVRNKPLLKVKDACSIDEGELSEYVKELLQVSESGGRVAIVVNTVEAAKCIYSKLRHRGNVILIHSRFTLEDRLAKLEALRRSKNILLVTTQVLEVGVDISFDAMLSQVSPPSSLIQRMGRLARGESVQTGLWAVFATEDDLKEGSHVYQPEAVKHAWDTLKSVANAGYKVNWHLPRSINGSFKGYMDILEGAWLKDAFSVIPSFYKTLTSPMITSRDVEEFLKTIGGFRDENICSLYPVDVADIQDFERKHLVARLWPRSIPIQCDLMLRYVRGIIIEHKAQAHLLERDSGDWDIRRLDEERLLELKKHLKRDPFSFPIKYPGVVIPPEFYEGGVYGVGLK